MSSATDYQQVPSAQTPVVRERDIETAFLEKLRELKYTNRPDIRDRASLEANFRQKFEALNRVRLTDAEFARLLHDLVSPDVFKTSVRLREKNDFIRDDGTPLSYTLVNIRDWCKNDFEVVHQLRINTDYSHHRYDVHLLINGVPVVQVELKTLRVSPSGCGRVGMIFLTRSSAVASRRECATSKKLTNRRSMPGPAMIMSAKALF